MNQKPGQLTTLKNVLLITVSTYVSTAMGLLVSTIIARNLDPHAYGQYAYLAWLSGLLVIFSNHGLGISGIRFVSEYLGRGDRETAAQIHAWLAHWLKISALIVTGTFALVCWRIPLAGWETNIALLLSIVVVSAWAKSSFLFDISIAKGHKLFHVESITNTVMSLLYAGGVALIAFLNGNLQTYAVFFGVISAMHVVMVKRMMRKSGISQAASHPSADVLARVKPHLWWTIMLIAVATLSNKSVEIFLLGVHVGPAEVGYFTIAATLTRGGIELLSSSLTATLMPSMAHAYGSGGMTKVNDILSDAVRHFLFFGLVICGVGTLWAEPGVHILYGERYQPVTVALQVMVLIGGLTLPEGAFGALLSTTDHQRLRASIAGLSLLISAAAAFMLVPRWGLNGALISYGITRTLIFLVTAVSIKLALGAKLPLRELGRQLIAALTGGLASWAWVSAWPDAWSHVIAGVVYLVVFLAATVVLGAWRAKDAEILLAIAERKPAWFGRASPHIRRWAAGLR